MNDKQLRGLAHARLKQWAQDRAAALERLSAGLKSPSDIIREHAMGGSASTAPSRLTGPEARCATHESTLRTEQAFRCLPDRHRSVVGWKYLREQPVTAWAEQANVPPSSAAKLVAEAMAFIGLDLAYGDRAKSATAKLGRRERKRAARGAVAPLGLQVTENATILGSSSKSPARNDAAGQP